MTPQSEESKKRMDAIFNSRKHLKYPPATLDEIAEDEFKAGYQSGIKDPEANSEKIKQLEGLLGECEVVLQKIVDEFNQPTEGVLIGALIARLDNANHFSKEVFKKLKAAKEGGE